MAGVRRSEDRAGHHQGAGRGKVLKIRVQVEKGVAVDPEKFAGFVLATLNDKRSWTENGTRRFARTDRAADAFTTVTLASPQTSADLCRPLRTFGKLSCRNGNRVILTSYRWVKAIPEYKATATVIATMSSITRSDTRSGTGTSTARVKGSGRRS